MGRSAEIVLPDLSKFHDYRCDAIRRSLLVPARVFTPEPPWWGSLTCKRCSRRVTAFAIHEWSWAFPHFYCRDCSNVLRRDSDTEIVWRAQEQGVLDHSVVDQIAATLPECPCGGRFLPGANPKCPSCCAEFAHQDGVVTRLLDERPIVIHGACFLDDHGLSFRAISPE